MLEIGVDGSENIYIFATLSSDEFDFSCIFFILWHNISKKFLLERGISK